MTQQPQTEPGEGPDFSAIKTKQNATWSSGDYAKIGVALQLAGEELAEVMDLPVGSRALDVAAGNGNVTLALARRQCTVTSTDYVAELLKRGQARTEVEGFDVEFQVADAEALPFDDNSFDGVASTFGVMFTPNQEQSAAELQRVCKSGGKIGMANWTPEGFIGQLFKLLSGYVPPPAGLNSPARWGTEAWINQTFSAKAVGIEFFPKTFKLRFASPEEFVRIFRTYYGPVHKAFLALDNEQQETLARDLIKLINEFNVAKDGSAVIASDYVQVIVEKA